MAGRRSGESVTGRRWSLWAGQGEVEQKGPFRAEVKRGNKDCSVRWGLGVLGKETNSKTASYVAHPAGGTGEAGIHSP